MAFKLSYSNIKRAFSTPEVVQPAGRFVPHIFINSSETDVNEAFKTLGIVSDDKNSTKTLNNLDKSIKPHPFDFSIMTGLYTKFGPVTGVVDKYNDYILGPGFFVKSTDSRAAEIINQHIKEFDLYNVMSEVIRVALPVGTLGLEMKKDSNTGVPDGYKIIPPDTFYIKVDESGDKTGYCQIPKKNSKDVIPLELDDVALFTINKMGDYGLGIIYPAMSSINNIIQSSKDLHTLQSRKANSPVWWKLGGEVDGQMVEPGETDISQFGQELENLNNKTEFCTGPLVEAKVIDFGNIGDKFSFIMEYDWKMYYTTVQVPAVLLGDANVNEGIANVQMDGFQRRIKSFQEELEKVMENQIFKVILEANGLPDAKVEVVWGLPSEMQKADQMVTFTTLLSNPLLSFELRDELEMKVAELLDIDLVFEKPAEERKREEEEQKQPIVPGQQKQPLKQVKKEPNKKNEHVCEHKGCTCSELYSKEELKEDYSIEEWVGFSYKDYKEEIDKAITRDDFSQVLAKTAPEIAAGKLTETQVVALKQVLRDGINNDWTMKEISNEIKKRVKPRTLWKLKDGKIVKKDGKRVLQLSAKFRPISIARSEIVRVSNSGAKSQYEKMGAKQYKWISTISERTCEICLGLDGTVYNIGDSVLPPAHTMCRCSIIPIVE